MHALFKGQSLFIVHSGRQVSYGLPKKSGKHLHAPAPFLSKHTALSPHGDGSQGFDGRLISSLEQPMNGSPVYPLKQEQIGE